MLRGTLAIVLGLFCTAGWAAPGWAAGPSVAEVVADCGAAIASSGPETAARVIAEALADPQNDPIVPAEALWQLAQQGELGDPLAAAAADLLDHDDPFVRALAEWAIAIRVNSDNNGRDVVWPQPDPPSWFSRWSELDGDFLIEADYARLAVTWDIHRDGGRLLDSLGKIIERARGAAGEVAPTAPAETHAMVAEQLAALEEIRRELARRVEEAPEDLVSHRRLWLAARRAARPIVLANEAVDFDQIVFIMRHSAHSHRNITGSQYPWVHKPGGDVVVKMGLDPADPVRGVIDGQLGPGHVRGIDLWWDGDRVVFGFARQPGWPPEHDPIRGNHVFLLRGQQTPIHLYEIGIDGSGLRQVTGHPYWSDLEPTYTADGRIVFASDRNGRSSECGRFSADHTVVNLYSVTPDGRTIRRLSDNKDIDRYPHSLDDGTIAYTRWEYQERHFFEVHSIWRVRPDGTMADAVFGQHDPAPMSFRDTRSVPGTSKLVSIASGHHTFAYGSVVVVDPRAGINHVPDAIRIVTPHIRLEEGPMAGQPVPEGGVPDRVGLFQTPWALSESCFLVSYSPALPPSNAEGDDNATGFALYLIDVHGNKELIHRDQIYSSAFPIPLKPRQRPPVLPDATDPARQWATTFVGDVYQDLEGIERGAAKYLRISQRIGWPLDAEIGAMRYIPGNAWEYQFGYWAWAPPRVIGTVPVEEDGSAHFRVPVDEAVYFQLLDENHMELRRMRSHITFQPGEVRGCVGCHESKPTAPLPSAHMPSALRRPPQVPQPPPWGAERLLGYEWLVQPIFERHCVTCHESHGPGAAVDLTATPTEGGFFQSFRTLFGQPTSGGQGPVLVSLSDRFSGSEVTEPKEFGSHRSRLARVLLDDSLHRDEVDLSEEEWIALVTWIDANAPYHDTFYNRRPADGGPPRRDVRPELPSPFASRSLPLLQETPLPD